MANFVSLEGLQGLSKTSSFPAPRIDIYQTFLTDSTGVPMTCDKIIPAAKAAGSADNFLSIYKLQNSKILDNFTGFYNSLTNTNINQLQNIKNSTYNDIDSYLTKTEGNIILTLENVKNCIDEANISENTDNLKETAEESKLRYESMLAPEERVSYYEGWFPLFRPMTEAALFGLFGVSIFLLLISIFIFLRMNGIELKLILPSYDFDLSFTAFLANKKFYMIGGAVVGAIVAYTGYRRKWF